MQTCFRLLPLLALFSGVAHAEPNMRDGMWEITTRTEIQGLPAGSMPPSSSNTVKQCMTREEAIPREPENNPNCKLVSSKVQGNTVSWNMQCRGREGTTESSGRIVYSGNTFSGETRVNTSGGVQKMNMLQKMSGRRIGECK